MQFFVEEATTLYKATDPHLLAERVPGMRESLEAVSDLRQFYRDTGQAGFIDPQRDWKHVASIKAPVMDVTQLLDPQFLNRNGKKDFYRWLDSHPGYIAYDRRAALSKRLFHGWSPSEASSS